MRGTSMKIYIYILILKPPKCTDPARKMYDIYHFFVYSGKLLMLDR